ncbi:uncharacterized protein LOC126382111 [Pectinophora gossypiella]|uniref:uncharacterized protein LOC126382111 n=1 Tax=Pectinophora gossypiella TaxID=13191 RepID=UPI00214F07DD|nr:uncharacterized protein LOC126382111 [Pectinophora gossypiella]
MWFGRVFVICSVILWEFCKSQDVPEEIPSSETISSEEITTNAAIQAEKKMSEHILAVMEHFKKPDPMGIPGVEIPDPYSVPDMRKSVTFFDTLYLERTAVHGISKLRVLYINADFEDMEVRAAMYIDNLQARGTYRYSSLLMPRMGPFTVNVTGLQITPRASLGVEIDGKLSAQDIVIDLSFDTISVNFENLGALGSVLQSFINGAGNFVFDSIKPYILQDAYKKARIAINEKLEEIADDVKFPNSIAPLDMVLVDVRRSVREMGLDPYKADDFNKTDISPLFIALTNTWIMGLSTVHRIGDMIIKLENNTAIVHFEIGSQKLEGTTQWEVSAGGLVSLAGTGSFSVEYVSASVVIAQPLDTRNKPILEEFHLDVGNIQARCDGAGTIDYIIEFAVNILPNLLRYQIVAALEGPLVTYLQNELNAVDVEEEIKMALPRIDELAETDFKLSMLRGDNIETYDEDDFFNF